MNINDQSFFYQDSAETIVDSIISLLSQGIKQFESYEPWLYDVPISSEEEGFKHFNWRFEVCRSDSKENFSCDFFGLAGRDHFDEPSIDITLVLPKGKHQKSTNIDRAELFDVVSHEIHHLAQNIENNAVSKKTKELGRLSYFLDPYEIEAFHIGIRAHSAISGKSFRSIAKNYLEKSWPQASKHQIERVICAWANTNFDAFNYNYKKRVTAKKNLYNKKAEELK